MIPTILIAAALAACPNNVSLVQDTGGDGNVLNQYCTGYVDGGIINLTNIDGWQGNMADLTDEKLCAPATEEYPCCSYIFYAAGSFTGENTHRCYDTEGPVNSAMYNWIDNGLVCSATRQEYLWFPSSSPPDRYEVIRNCMLSASSPAPPAPAPVTPAPPADDSGLSAGAIAGIAVGAVLAVVAAGVVLL